MKVVPVLLVFGVLSLIPIWKDPTADGAMSFWNYWMHMTGDVRPHIPYQVAVMEAQEAFENSR